MAEKSQSDPSCPHMTSGSCTSCQGLAEIEKIIQRAKNQSLFLVLTQNEIERIYKLAKGGRNLN